MNCLHCHAETTNGLALCELCQRLAETALQFLPVYFRNLARWRPGRSGSRSVPGSRVLWDGSEKRGDHIADALDEAANAVTTWARALVDDRPDYPRPLTMADAVLTGDLASAINDELAEDQPLLIAWLCVALEYHLTSIATMHWCGEFVRELTSSEPKSLGHEPRLRALTEASVPGWYAGACRMCELPTYVVPGLTWVTCNGCGSTTYARDRLEIVLKEARMWIAPPKRIAEAIVALVDTEMSVERLRKRITKWGDRDRIASHRRTEPNDFGTLIEIGPRRYMLGEVLDALRSDGATRLDVIAERVG